MSPFKNPIPVSVLTTKRTKILEALQMLGHDHNWQICLRYEGRWLIANQPDLDLAYKS